MFVIVALAAGRDDFAVYSGDGSRGPFGTPMMFRGSLASCIDWRKENA